MIQTATRQPPHVLIAEDEYFLAEDFAEDLQAAGAQVIAVTGTLSDLRAAIKTAGHIDCAVLDINLRGEMVYPAADDLIARQVPVVFATGYDDTAIPKRYAAVPRCSKPVCSIELIKTVQHALAGNG
jgi:CheY-like chemotaxis protein